MGNSPKRLMIFLPAVVLLLISTMLSGFIQAEPTDLNRVTASSNQDVVKFTLSAPQDVPDKQGSISILLLCEDHEAARAGLHYPDQTEVNVPIANHLEGQCQVKVESQEQEGFTDEITILVSSTEGDVERSTQYSHDGNAVSRAFDKPDGDLSIDVSVGAIPGDEVGTPLKVMSFNIWQGGRLDGRHEHGWEDENVNQLVEFLRFEDPDVLFLVETYGAGDQILEALNRNQPEGRKFTGIQVTREPNQAPDRDNLWLFTWLPVEKVYPVIREGGLTSFNFGGARLGLPDGGHVHAFSTWLHHTGGTTTELSRTAFEIALGYDRTYTNEQLLAADYVRRMEMANTLLNERLQTYIGNDTAPVILGGDFNTQSHLDWTEQFADAPGHEGLVLEWPVLKSFEEAGFIDTFRHANPDAARFPGRTWSAGHSFTYAPSRIDYILARGEQVRILASSTRTVRLPEQQGTALDELYPFYSDHAAVVTEMVIRGQGTGPDPEKQPVFDPELEAPSWPEPLPGTPVPANELTATASSVRPGSEPENAVDGNPLTIWHSRSQPDPPDPHPHTLDVDMGRERLLSGVNYHPRIDGGYYGLVTRYTLQASLDGENFHTVASGRLERTPLPKNIELSNVTARYLRFIVESGVGGFTAVAMFSPYEKDAAYEILLERINSYKQSGDLSNSAAKQLENKARQSQHHKDKGSGTQAIKFLNDMLDLLKKGEEKGNVSKAAKLEIQFLINQLIDRMD